MSAFLFSDHEADDLVVRLPHAVLPEQADAADSALDVFHDDPVSALELLAVLVHVESQDAGVYGECDLSCAGCLGAVADNAGSDGKRIDHSVDDRLVIPAAEVSDTRACACSGADSSAVGGEGADAGLLVDGHQIGEGKGAAESFVIGVQLPGIFDQRYGTGDPLVAAAGIDDDRELAAVHTGVGACRCPGFCAGGNVIAGGAQEDCADVGHNRLGVLPLRWRNYIGSAGPGYWKCQRHRPW